MHMAVWIVGHLIYLASASDALFERFYWLPALTGNRRFDLSLRHPYGVFMKPSAYDSNDDEIDNSSNNNGASGDGVNAANTLKDIQDLVDSTDTTTEATTNNGHIPAARFQVVQRTPAEDRVAEISDAWRGAMIGGRMGLLG
ncbi:unnamed protein product [Anisakis simplex]|uniref:Transferred entry: 7.1.1.6 n=1 Tax=Anisakis simplex TaxID=6269 RepID=A0A0M3K841_ANISI|nr:unnamed protein product [Anisakis simplex]